MSPRPPSAAAPSPTLATWLAERRWYAGPGAPGAVAEQRAKLPTRPGVTLALVATEDGARYQLVRPTSADPEVHDCADDAPTAAALARFVAGGGTAAGPDGTTVTAHVVAGASRLGSGTAHPIGGEQSNTSVVVGGTHVLKVLRQLRSGPNPEVEIGRHLAAVAATGRHVPVAPLAGWYDLEEGTTTTLGVLHELVPGALDAWALVLSALAGGADGLLGRLHLLGTAVADLHGALAQPGDEPATFGAAPLTTDRVAAVVDALRADAPAALGDLDVLVDPTAVVARAGELAGRLGDDLGAAICHHGDLHLGQVVLGPDGWVILDFEGEPARPVADRRQDHSPLRDVAGMLRSFAYAAATHRRSGGRRLGPGWEPAARAAFLDGYLATVDPALVPSSAAATAVLLHLFELEKAVYEVGYERAHRPDWVAVPVEGLRHLLVEDRT